MRNCVMCATRKEQVTLVQVVPGAWTGFNNYADICGDCQESERFLKLVKQKKIIP